ncbi:hypothetical protein SUDANB176_07652 (plasmid) [Streptomyces sp. enrichment culture]|uniref:ACT domain-containing protein n=1 Tax=Streptomyces sp. enrichment culture TaxID=1795815 RepID=UPI003F56D83E
MNSGRGVTLLPGEYAIVQYPADADLPTWACRESSQFLSVTRTADELSVICPVRILPDATRCDIGWHCLRVNGTSGLDEPGVLVSVAGPLAAADLSVFVIATYATDYVLVRDAERAAGILRSVGHEVHGVD